MKQFQYVNCGRTYGPYTAKEVSERFPLSATGVADLNGTSTYTDLDGDVWSIVPDLVLQDDQPLTAEDVTALRESASRVRYKLRLERIATPVFASMVNASPMLSDAVLARTAVDFAKALIAELDKQS